MAGPERTVLFVYNTGLVAKLVGKGHFKGKSWQLGAGTFTMGREPTNNLVLENEPGVSKVHCKITLEDKKYVLVDAESRNGTLLNGAPIKRAVLKDGDEVRICDVILGFEQELAMPERPGSSPPADEDVEPPPQPFQQAQVQTESTQRKSLPLSAEPDVTPPKAKTSTGYFVLGMLLCFGGLGAGALFTGMVTVNGLNLSNVNAPTPREVPPKPVDGPTEPPPKEDPNAGTSGHVEKTVPEPTSTGTTTSPPPASGKDLEGVLKLVPGVVTAGAGGTGVEVKHTLNARVSNVVAKPGKEFRKGQVLLTYDDAEAQRRLATARVQYDSIKEVAATQDTERARKFLAEAKVDLDRASSAVANLKLVAPQDGVVSQVTAEAGKRVGKGTVAVVFGGSGGEAGPPQWKVVFRVPDDKSARFKDGATVTVSLGAATASGFVETVEKGADGMSVTAVLAKELPGAKDGAAVKVK